jgi:hypothetical protein
MVTQIQNNSNVKIRNIKHYIQHHQIPTPARSSTGISQSNIPPSRTPQLEYLIQEPLLGITQFATHTISSSDRSVDNLRAGKSTQSHTMIRGPRNFSTLSLVSVSAVPQLRRVLAVRNVGGRSRRRMKRLMNIESRLSYSSLIVRR